MLITASPTWTTPQEQDTTADKVGNPQGRPGDRLLITRVFRAASSPVGAGIDLISSPCRANDPQPTSPAPVIRRCGDNRRRCPGNGSSRPLEPSRPRNVFSAPRPPTPDRPASTSAPTPGTERTPEYPFRDYHSFVDLQTRQQIAILRFIAQLAAIIMPPSCGANPPPVCSTEGVSVKKRRQLFYCLLLALVSASRLHESTPYIEHLQGFLFQGNTPSCQWWSRVL